MKTKENRLNQDNNNHGKIDKDLVEIFYSRCEKVVLDLNTHSISSLYKAFEATIAKQITQWLIIHNTPIYAFWLNMAEFEIAILYRQCLSPPLSSFEFMAC